MFWVVVFTVKLQAIDYITVNYYNSSLLYPTVPVSCLSSLTKLAGLHYRDMLILIHTLLALLLLLVIRILFLLNQYENQLYLVNEN